jgi:poly(3-hydroxybutyrate) depolymerase
VALALAVAWLAAGCGGTATAPTARVGANTSASASAREAVRGTVGTDSYYFSEAGKEIEYAYYVPSTYVPGRKAPLVILLHGLFSNPGQVIRYAGVTAQAEARGYIVVAPYGYNDRGWYGSMGPGRAELGGIGRGRRGDPGPDNLGELSERDVWNVLALAQRRFSIDPNRIYIMGHSMGGGGSLHLAMRRPDVWAAVAAFSPAIFGDPTRLRAMQALPVIVVQGDEDRLVQVENTRRWIEQMRSLDMEHRYVEIAGGDHIASIARNPSMIAEVFDFLDAHRRSAR